METRLFQTLADSPLGPLILTAKDDAILKIDFDDPKRPYFTYREKRENAPLISLRRELDAYFAGELDEFTVRLARRVSAFQMKVLDVVRAIPVGQTRSYSEIANSIGAPRAVRAVGGANAKNPWPIVVPCHRVVGANGQLTGYAGGLERKEWLLRHEGALLTA
jgi:methylated-DNA-[protein]-cysteine S-methyltransferase